MPALYDEAYKNSIKYQTYRHSCCSFCFILFIMIFFILGFSLPSSLFPFNSEKLLHICIDRSKLWFVYFFACLFNIFRRDSEAVLPVIKMKRSAALQQYDFLQDFRLHYGEHVIKHFHVRTEGQDGFFVVTNKRFAWQKIGSLYPNVCSYS